MPPFISIINYFIPFSLRAFPSGSSHRTGFVVMWKFIKTMLFYCSSAIRSAALCFQFHLLILSFIHLLLHRIEINESDGIESISPSVSNIYCDVIRWRQNEAIISTLMDAVSHVTHDRTVNAYSIKCLAKKNMSDESIPLECSVWHTHIARSTGRIKFKVGTGTSQQVRNAMIENSTNYFVFFYSCNKSWTYL